MAEANTEMLEAQLTQIRASPRIPSGENPVTPASAVKPAVVPTSAAANAAVTPEPARTGLEQRRAVVPASVPGRRPVEDRARQMSLRLPPVNSAAIGPASAAAAEGKGVFNFWAGGKKKLPGGLGTVNIPSPNEIMAALPASRPATPSREFDGFDFHNTGPVNETPKTKTAADAVRRANDSPGLARSMSQSALPTLATSPNIQRSSTLRSSAPSQSSEMHKLRSAYAGAQGRIDGMAKELAELKKGKVDMEAELENLSQALFEEANKMVADERRKRAEVEENLKEVREEREALRETIKVLGGNVEEQVEEDDKFDAASFEPRDLDKHYEALRKTIHHIADGAEEGPDLEGLAGTTVSPETRAVLASSPENLKSAIPPSVVSDSDMAAPNTVAEPTSYTAPPDAAPPLDPNPWSDPSPPEPAKIGLGIDDGSTLGEPPGTPAEDLDRLMAKLQADMEEK